MRSGAVRTGTSIRSPVRIVSFYLALAVLAVWASLGPAAGLYSWLAESLPFMSFLRAPARLGVVVVFGLSAIAGLGWRPPASYVQSTFSAVGSFASATPESAAVLRNWR